jgi:hypothetical protein
MQWNSVAEEARTHSENAVLERGRKMLRQTALSLMLPFWLVTSVALGQQRKTVTPPPKPKDEGPSLSETMKFIQTKLNEVGKINFADYVHNNVTNSDWVVQNSSESTNVVADPAACRITYHMKILVNGDVAFDKDANIPLKEVQDLTVKTVEEDIKTIDVGLGFTTRSYRADPPIFVLTVRRSGNGSNAFDFADEETTNRVAKAMVHAVELCGGGNKDPF